MSRFDDSHVHVYFHYCSNVTNRNSRQFHHFLEELRTFTGQLSRDKKLFDKVPKGKYNRKREPVE